MKQIISEDMQEKSICQQNNCFYINHRKLLSLPTPVYTSSTPPTMNIPQRFQTSEQTNFYQQHHKIFSIQKETTQYQQESDLGSDIAISHSAQLYTPFTYEQNLRPIIQGWIKKKTLNTSYQQRYFVLTPTRLCYFTSDSKTEPKGCFNLVSLLKYNPTVSQQQCQIKLKLSPKTHSEQFQNRYILQMEFTSREKLCQWYTQLNTVISRLNLKHHVFGKQMLQVYPQISIDNLVQMNQKFSQYNSNFWNKFDISVQQLSAYSSHLDILLLRNKKPVAYVSRFFMRSHYDHVALIIKSELHQLFVFQAIQSRGVSLLDLDTFLKINQEEYEEIAFRKLVVKEGEEKMGFCKGINLEKLESYLNSLLGKKYQLSLSKLLIDDTEYDASKESAQEVHNQEQTKIQQTCKSPIQSKSPQQNKSPSSIKDLPLQTNNQNISPKPSEKTFFCSQLIADIYLKFGIIREGKSKDFWPKDFEENQIKFRENTTFSPIMNVCFK